MNNALDYQFEQMIKLLGRYDIGCSLDDIERTNGAIAMNGLLAICVKQQEQIDELARIIENNGLHLMS